MLTLGMAGCGNTIESRDITNTVPTTTTVTSGSTETQTSVPAESVTESAATTTTTAKPETTTTTTTTTPETTTTTTTTPETTTTTTTTTAAKTTTTTTTRPRSTGNTSYLPSYGEWVGNIVICDRYEGERVRGLPPFYGLNSNAQAFANVVNSYKQMVGSGVNVYNLGCPLASAYYCPKTITGNNGQKPCTDQKSNIQMIGQYLSGVTNVDVYDALAAHVEEYIYTRTDHHWQPLGAYYAAKEFAAAAGVPFTDISQMTEYKKTGFTGSLYGYSNNAPEFKQYPDTYIYYKPKNSYTTTYYNSSFTGAQSGTLFYDSLQGSGCYCTILGNDVNIAEIKTDVGNGRVLVLIKDSYGNAMVPFFVGSFEKIYVVDFRHVQVKMKDFFKKVGATDILFGMSLSSEYADTHIARMRTIMQ